MTAEPTLKPERPFFSSGPTAKHKGWSAANLKTESLGRSHRSALGKSRLKYAIDLSKEMLGVPEDYLVGIMPASDTGALECAMWTMLRPDRPATVAAWESFGNVWIQDAVKQLKLPNLQVMDADYGEIPDLASIPQDNDVVFTWNGTTSGAKIPDTDTARTGWAHHGIVASETGKGCLGLQVAPFCDLRVHRITGIIKPN